jgi:iron complex transport system substrate-binding protein
MAADFPLTIEHKFGTTVIEEKPERVASLDYNGADNLLALGIQPVAIRHWYGDYENSVWPWSQNALTTTPEILKGELNFEQITATKPDVIIAIWSGITAEDYQRLSLIAPVVAVPEGMGDYAMPWYQQALTAGSVVGEKERAQSLVDAIQSELNDASTAHPHWQDKTVAVASAWQEGSVGAYTSQDIRPLLLSDLGFKTPEAIDSLINGNEFWVTFSLEDLSPLDTDVLIWVTDGTTTNIDGLVARRFLNVFKEKREVFLGNEVTGAFSHATLLSLPFAIETLISELETVIPN